MVKVVRFILRREEVCEKREKLESPIGKDRNSEVSCFVTANSRRGQKRVDGAEY